MAASALTLQVAAPAAAGAAPPTVGRAWISNVTSTAAKLSAEVNPNGESTGVCFEYLTQTAYEANLAASIEPFTGAVKLPNAFAVDVGSGTGTVEFSRTASGLKAATAYRFRLVASSLFGASHSIAVPFATREANPVFALPDGRGWEMVSPPIKNGGGVEGPEAIFGGGVFQAAAQGGAVTYTSGSAFAAPPGAPGANQYISSRTASGWATENITPALLSGSYPSAPDSGAPFQLFSADLSAALMSNGKRCRAAGSDCPVANPPLPGSDAPSGYRNYYLRSSGDGSFRALLSTAGISGLALGPEEFEVGIAGATENLSQIVLVSCAAITADAIEVPGTGGECDPAATNLYRYANGTLALVNLKPGETQGVTGAKLAAPSGAISSDGSRVYFTLAGSLYLREGAQTVQVDGAQGGGGVFQVATSNGAVAYFLKAEHLYRYDAASKTTTDLAPAEEVQGVLGASADGSRVYYLTSGGLFTRVGATTTKVADVADATNQPPATGTARVSASGNRLAFLSSSPLTGYDNEGQPEVYLYDAPTSKLTCASCNPTGEKAQGPSTIPGAIANGKALQAYKPRVLSADGQRLFFNSPDALALQDTNNEPDVYQWEAKGSGSCQKQGGCIDLISSGRSEDGARFIDTSADGADVYFTTDGSLVPGDPGAVDLYDARVGGGFPFIEPPIPCVGDACQPIPGEPDDPTPGTLLQRPVGNPALSFLRKGQTKPKRKTNKGKGKKKGSKKAKKRVARRAQGGAR